MTWRRALAELRRHDSVFWRRAIDAGVTHGPDAFVRWSPPLFGLAFCASLPDKRRVVLRNLRLARGRRAAAIEAIDVARTFTNFASCMTDAFVAGSDRDDRLTGSCVRADRFQEAARDGRGVIIATAHTGGWQSAHALLKEEQGADVIVVMRRERDARAQAILDEVRDRSGVRILHVGNDPLEALPLMRHLRGKGVVALQIDRLPQGVRGRKGQLFGTDCVLPEGPLRLAALTGAPIVSAFSRRLGYMRYELTIGAPIRISRRPSEAELDRAAAAMLGELERFVAAHPTQWFHFE